MRKLGAGGIKEAARCSCRVRASGQSCRGYRYPISFREESYNYHSSIVVGRLGGSQSLSGCARTSGGLAKGVRQRKFLTLLL